MLPFFLNIWPLAVEGEEGDGDTSRAKKLFLRLQITKKYGVYK